MTFFFLINLKKANIILGEKMSKLFLTVLIVGTFVMSVFAQNSGTLRGKIVNPDNNPVVGATVSIEGTSQKVLTDNNGAFSFEGFKFWRIYIYCFK